MIRVKSLSACQQLSRERGLLLAILLTLLSTRGEFILKSQLSCWHFCWFCWHIFFVIWIDFSVENEYKFIRNNFSSGFVHDFSKYSLAARQNITRPLKMFKKMFKSFPQKMLSMTLADTFSNFAGTFLLTRRGVFARDFADTLLTEGRGGFGPLADTLTDFWCVT